MDGTLLGCVRVKRDRGMEGERGRQGGRKRERERERKGWRGRDGEGGREGNKESERVRRFRGECEAVRLPKVGIRQSSIHIHPHTQSLTNLL
jgi:ribosomal protein L15